MKDINKKLDIEHSKHIRLKNTDEYGIGYCYTCGERITYKNGECGHYPYVSRDNMEYRWDIDLHRIQCHTCNCDKQGNPESFRDNLINEMGFEKLSRIEFNSKKPFKWFEFEKEQLLKWFKKENAKLIKSKMIKI